MARSGFVLIACLWIGGDAYSDDLEAKCPSAQDVIKRSISALGGKERILWIMKSHIRTKAKAGNDRVDVQEWSDGLDRHKTMGLIETNGVTVRVLRVRNGTSVFERINDGDVSIQKADAIKARAEADIHNLARLLFPFVEAEGFSLEFRGQRDEGSGAAYWVRVKSKEQPDLDLFFDKTTAFLLKYAYRGNTGVLRGKNVEHSFTSYQDFDGMKYATKSTITIDGVVFAEDEVMELRLLKELPKGTFDKP